MKFYIAASDDTKYFANMCNITAEEDIYYVEQELKANPVIYLKMLPCETKEEAVERMMNKLYAAGFDILNSSLTTETTEIQTL